MKTILKNCKLITPPFSEEKLYDIFIEGGLIADIGENLHVEDAKELDHMHVSGGKLGMQLTLLPEDLAKAANAQFADVIHKD